MTEIKTIEVGQKRCLLTRGDQNYKKIKVIQYYMSFSTFIYHTNSLANAYSSKHIKSDTLKKDTGQLDFDLKTCCWKFFAF